MSPQTLLKYKNFQQNWKLNYLKLTSNKVRRKIYNFKLFFFSKNEHSLQDIDVPRAAVLNRGAAEPLGVVRSSRGAANLWTWRLFTSQL